VVLVAVLMLLVVVQFQVDQALLGKAMQVVLYQVQQVVGVVVDLLL
jgi:hypothetical protein